MDTRDKHLRAIFKNTVDGIIGIDEGGLIKLFNPAALSLFGYTWDEVADSPISMLMPEPHRSKHTAYIETYLRTGESEIIGEGREVYGKRKDGTVFPLYLAVNEYILDGNRHFIASIHDVTESKRIHDDLQRAKEKAEEADLIKRQFLMTMSHELRTPLNGILGFADMLSQEYVGELNEKQLEYVAHIDQSGKHLLELVTDLLDFSKAEAGGIELDRGPIPVSALIQTAIAMLEVQARGNGITIEGDEGDDLVADGDTLRCNQILLNLIGNAIKFSPEGGRIEVRAEKQNDSYVKFTVRDNGPGIDAADQSKIFSEFYQVDRARDANLGGSGIGLALARSLVELHGGEIGVVSRPGKGSEFWFTLPLWESCKSTRAEVVTRNDLLDGFPVERRILVAEDDEISLSLILALLEVHRHEVIVAKNGQEAVELAQEFRPDLILMDMQMPVMNGVEATRRIRKMAGFENLPIIALTANADSNSVTRCLEAGCDAHVSKPFGMEQLFSVLQRCLTPDSRDNASP